MTIDEAIAHEKELSKEVYVEAMLCHANPNDEKLDGCIERGKYHEQLAEWLEDYKQIKMLVPIEQALKTEYNKGYSKAENDYYVQSEKDRQSSYDCGYEAGYFNGIYAYMNKLCNHCIQQSNECDKFECPFCSDSCDIVKIAERLKAGEENE